MNRNTAIAAATLLSASFLFSICGCAPSVRLNTPEPLKVDINMRVDVYQKETPAQTKAATTMEEEAKALRRRDDRAAEVWAMKNDGVVTEGASGYLAAHTLSGWDPTYVNRLVSEENRDRRLIYEREALQRSRPLASVETEAGLRLRQQAYGRKQQPSVTSTNMPSSLTTTNQAVGHP